MLSYAFDVQRQLYERLLDVGRLGASASGAGNGTLYPAHRFGPQGACSFGTRPPWSNIDRTKPYWDMSGLPTLHIGVAHALEYISSNGWQLSRRVVNIGAMDGRCDGGPSSDPANCLMLATPPTDSTRRWGWGGLVIEAKAPDILFERFADREDVVLITHPVYPETIVDVVREAMVADADLLKIDIDSFDCDIITVLLRVGPLADSPPKFLYVDFNPHIPPPFLYRGVAGAQVPLQGASLQCFLEAAPGFTLLHVELFNALFVRNDLAPLFPATRAGSFEKWALGYFCNPLARVLWHRERDIRWMGADPRLWADQNRSLAERGESIVRLLGRMRAKVSEQTNMPSFHYTLTW